MEKRAAPPATILAMRLLTGIDIRSMPVATPWLLMRVLCSS